jgi:TFIIF-interacting CTD phosphatase-like protein
LDLNNILLKVYLYASEDTDAILPISKGKEEISIKLHTYIFDFLDDMKTKYELIIYSSLNRKYLQPILKYLEREKKYFEYSFDETFCLYANVFQGIKYLNFLCSTRSIKDIIVVDTSIKNFPLNSQNVITVPWNLRSPEAALAKLGVVLNEISNESDVRAAIGKYAANDNSS